MKVFVGFLLQACCRTPPDIDCINFGLLLRAAEAVRDAGVLQGCKSSADGTCWPTVGLLDASYRAVAAAECTTTFPAAFAAAPKALMMACPVLLS